MVVTSQPVVAFDVTSVAGQRTGVGNAVHETYEALRAASIVPYAWGRRISRRASEFPSGTRFLDTYATALLEGWAYLGAPRIDAKVRPADVVHATAFAAPATRLPMLLTVYD